MTQMIRLDAPAAAAATVSPLLSQLEWNVVALALREGGAGERRMPTTRLGIIVARWWAALTGVEPRKPLADPRLEALRRFVASIGCRGEAAAAEALVGEGFATRQVEAIRTMAARG